MWANILDKIADLKEKKKLPVTVRILIFRLGIIETLPMWLFSISSSCFGPLFPICAYCVIWECVWTWRYDVLCRDWWLQVTGTKNNATSDRASKMFNRDCQLMGLTWLLARNKTTYIPTVSAVLRAIMYSAHPPHESTCSPDQENMPLAVDSLQMEKAQSSSPPSISLIPIIPLLVSVYWLAW